MGIKMNTYTGNQMTAEYDGIIQHRAIPESGILYGCEISYMGSNQVHIEKGYIMIMGRFCTVTEETIKVAMSSSSTEIPGRLYIHADLSDAQTPVKFMSVASNPLPTMVKDEDFNYTNGVYDLELATYTAGMTTIKNLVSTCKEITGGASMIGDNFSDQAAYSVGDYVIRKNTLYKFTTAHPAGAWNASHVMATTVAAELAAQNKNFGDLTFAQDADGNWGYKVGGADPVIPFKSVALLQSTEMLNVHLSAVSTYSLVIDKDSLIMVSFTSSRASKLTITKGGSAISTNSDTTITSTGSADLRVITFIASGGDTLDIVTPSTGLLLVTQII